MARKLRALLFAISLLPFAAAFYILVGMSVLAGVAYFPADMAAGRRARSFPAGTAAGRRPPEAFA